MLIYLDIKIPHLKIAHLGGNLEVGNIEIHRNQEDTSFMLKTLNDGVPSLHWCQVGHDTKWVRKAKIWSKMTKDVYFGPNLAILGLKIHFFEE